MIAALEARSMTRAAGAEEADLIIVNTCGFLEEARQESIDVILEFKAQYPGKRIIAAGCLSQRDGAQLSGILPELDGVFGNRAPGRIGEVVNDTLDGRRPVLIPEIYENAPQGRPALSIPGSSYLKIAEGCDNRCSFCSIPLIRGGLRSRPAADIVTDATQLIESGVREINLIAQDLGSYGGEAGGVDFTGLLKAILEIPGHYWIRMLYIHPDKFPFDVLDICESDSRLLPYFDIPIQHASKRILMSMGRKGDAGAYSELIRSIRSRLADSVIRTTFLLGYPGENRRDFLDLQNFQRDVSFDWLGAFRYSREKGTVAYSAGTFPGLVHHAKKSIIQARLDRVITAQQGISESRLSRFLGKTLDVLIEEPIYQEKLFLGRIYAQAPEVDGLTVVRTEKADVGRFIRCKITKVNGIDLEAVPV